jgi:choline kinase
MLKAVILAAGVASRLRPLTDKTPKCLLKIKGKTLLGMTLDNLQENGLFDLVLVTGFEAGQIRDFMDRKYPHLRVEYVHNPDYAITNNSFSLWLAMQKLDGHSMLLLDSDIVFEPSVIRKLLESGRENVVALNSAYKNLLGAEEIKIRMDPENRIQEISKEVNPALAAGESIGIELFGQAGTRHLYEVLKRRMLTEKRVNEFYEASFETMIKEGTDIYAVDIAPARCMEIDTPDDLKNAEKMLNLTVL